MKVNLKILEISAFIAMIVAIVISVNDFDSKCENIENSIFRLHVIANSDSNIDQEIKLKVRDAILEKGHELFADKNSKQQAEETVQKNLTLLRKIAEETIRKNGFDYDVTAEIGKSKFPAKTYGNTTLPAGEYDALRIILGEGKGKNWWCIMFPPLCLSAAREKVELDGILSDGEIELVDSNPRFEMRFWIVEKIRQFK